MQTIVDVVQFMRDGWRCQLCGSAVDQLRPVNKDNYAHLDHIIPLARGGQHIWSNVQTLCRKCNVKKSDSLEYSPGDRLEVVKAG
jgi:5-methylcytosine-specific restriction endonuclease McrA